MKAKQLTDQTLGENIAAIRQNIERAAVAAGRDPNEIRLLAVSKTMPAEKVVEITEHDLQLIGENRAQELLEKYDDYRSAGLEIHFIGHLQTNKVRQIVDKVSLIHSVGSVRLAAEIDRQVGLKGLDPMPILVEVNIGGEAAKSGVSSEELPALLAEIAPLRNVKIKGLMCIPPADADETETEAHFVRMHKLFVDTTHQKMDNVNMEILSMGMSGDYEPAIRHGSNLVRIGSALFGKRK